MRIAISSSCLTVIILLLVMIHCSIINKNYRDIEVNGSINDAFLYAADKAYSSYIDYNESDNNKDRLLGTQRELELGQSSDF